MAYGNFNNLFPTAGGGNYSSLPGNNQVSQSQYGANNPLQTSSSGNTGQVNLGNSGYNSDGTVNTNNPSVNNPLGGVGSAIGSIGSAIGSVGSAIGSALPNISQAVGTNAAWNAVQHGIGSGITTLNGQQNTNNTLLQPYESAGTTGTNALGQATTGLGAGLNTLGQASSGLGNGLNTLGSVAAGTNTGVNALGATATAGQTGQTALSNETRSIGQGTTGLADIAANGTQNVATSAYYNPGMAFALQQGQQALERSAAARGGVLNGASLKDISSYITGTASQNYNTAAQLAQNQTTLNQANTGQQITANQGLINAGNTAANTLTSAGLGAGQSLTSAGLGAGQSLANNGLSAGQSLTNTGVTAGSNLASTGVNATNTGVTAGTGIATSIAGGQQAIGNAQGQQYAALGANMTGGQTANAINGLSTIAPVVSGGGSSSGGSSSSGSSGGGGGGILGTIASVGGAIASLF